jgi:hypothetical protein
MWGDGFEAQNVEISYKTNSKKSAPFVVLPVSAWTGDRYTSTLVYRLHVQVTGAHAQKGLRKSPISDFH